MDVLVQALVYIYYGDWDYNAYDTGINLDVPLQCPCTLCVHFLSNMTVLQVLQLCSWLDYV